MGDRFPLPVNTVRVDGRAFPLSELTGRPSTLLVEMRACQHGPCWWVVEPVTRQGRQLRPLTRVVETGLKFDRYLLVKFWWIIVAVH